MTPAQPFAVGRTDHRVKLNRIFFRLFLLVVALAFILGALALVPGVQTSVAEWVLERHPNLHVSFEALSAGLGKVETENVRFERYGAVLSLPSLEAKLPVINALWNRKVSLQSLVAKGWTLDLRFTPEQIAAPVPPAPSAESEGGVRSLAQGVSSPAQSVVHAFDGLLSGWKLPFDGSVDGIDLEGDVLVPVGKGKERARVHVTIKGGGITSGREGVLAIDAGGTFLRPQILDLAAHASLVVTMDTPRSLSRVEMKADLSAKGGSPPNDFALAIDIAAARGVGEETYSVDLIRGDRHLATILARLPEATRQLAGNWKLDLRDHDLGPFAPDHPLPEGAVAGEGAIDTDTTFARVHALGHLSAVASHLGVLAPSLEPLGGIKLETHFDLARSGRLVRFDQLGVALAGLRPVAIAQSLQPFDFDERTGVVTLANPLSDWMDGSLRGLPWSWLSSATGDLSFSGGDLAGEFVVQALNGGFAFRGKLPFTAAGVDVHRAGSLMAEGLDLSVSVLADQTAQGWQVQCAPLTLSSANRRLATVEATASQSAGADHPVAIVGKWNVDLETFLSQPAWPGLRELSARSASGDFSATLGVSTKVEGNLTLAEQAADHSINVKLYADIGADHSVTFRAPLKIVRGSAVSELSTQGRWTSVKTGPQVSLRIASKDVDFEDLRLLASPWAVIAGGPSVAEFSSRTDVGTSDLRQMPGEARAKLPFWGDVVGRVYLAVDRLRLAGGDLQEVRGNLKLDHGSLRLETGQYVHPDHHRLGSAEGMISFDPAAPSPYKLKATFDDSEVDGATLFGAPAKGEDPPFHGRFSVASTLTGSGINFSDLVAQTQQEFQLKSKGGIVRLLKTRVTGLTPDRERPVADAAETVGTLVAKLAGMKRKSLDSGEVHLSKAAESVIDFTYQISEIGYDEVDITATRCLDGNIRIVHLAMIAPDEHVTGSGEITYVRGLSFEAEPLSADLKFGVRGKTALLLSTAGLLSSEKDNLGYTMLKQTVHFGGTLQHLDGARWHDLLVDAATRKPDSGTKDVPAFATKTKPEGSKP